MIENDLDPIAPRHIAYTHCNTTKIIVNSDYYYFRKKGENQFM